MSDNQKRYLGDGLYAEFDGYQFRLYTERDTGVHEVFLEREVLDAFMQFVATMKATRTVALDED